VPGRRGVVFSPNVATALDFAQQMNDAGIPTGTILGSTPKDERIKIYDAFRTGVLQWLTTAMVLTEGWNAPHCDALVIARKTKSRGLYQQMLGRGLRTFAGKQDCIVLDVCGVTELHGLASLTDLSLDGRVKPKDGQSLLEAMDEFDELAGVEWDNNEPFYSPAPPVHKVVGTEIDMFGSSHSVWLRTYRGTWFIPAGDQVFFLWPNGDGNFNLGRTAKIRPEPAILLHEDALPIELGMALLEQQAEAYAPGTADRNAPWRQTGPARPGQRNEMEMWGLTPKRKLSAADAYDQLNVEMASRRLDPVQ
jgi:hypothetical protein